MHLYANRLTRGFRQFQDREQALAQANTQLRQEIGERSHAELGLQANRADLQAQSESLAVINRISKVIHRSLDLHEVGDEAVRAIAAYFQVPIVVICGFDADTSVLTLIAGHGLPGAALPVGTVLPLEKTLSGYAVQHNEMLIIDDIYDDERADQAVLYTLRDLRVCGAAIVPLPAQDRVVGTLNLLFYQPQSLSPAEEETLTAVAHSIGIALANAHHVTLVESEIRERKRAEAALRVSESRYRSSFEDSPIALWEEDFSAVKSYLDALPFENGQDLPSHLSANPDVVDYCLKLVTTDAVNEATLTLFQAMNKQEIHGQLPSILAVAAGADFAQSLTTLWKGETPYAGEVALQTLTGKTIVGIHRREIAPGYEKTWSKIFNSLIDITKLQETQQALLAERDFARQVIENMGQGLCVANKEGVFQFVNSAFADMIGHPPETLLGKTPLDLATPEAQETFQLARQERRRGQTSSYETQMQHRSGAAIDVLITGVPQWRDERFAGSIAVVSNLTENKKATAAQLWLTNQLRTAANVARQVNEILDPDKLLAAVVALLQSRFDLYHIHIYLLDEERGELVLRAGSGTIGQQLATRGHAISLHETHSLVARAARERQLVLVNNVAAEPDFMPNPLLPGTQSEMAVPLIARDRLLGVFDVQEDEPERFSASDKDVFNVLARHVAIALQNAYLFAERKEAEERMAELITELEARNAELERFTYTVSHDLKSPLITIHGFLGFLEKDIAAGDMQRARDDMGRIRTATATMDVLLSDLLQLSRVGRIVNPPEWVPFDEIVRAAQERVAGHLVEKQVQLIVAPDLPDVFVDRARLVDVLQNLLDNGIKFMGSQPEPRIEVGVRHSSKGSLFFVRDNGAGIDPRFHDTIFGLFDRFDPEIEGTGIGLALVQRIIEVHNGHIWVESVGAGQGTTVFFTLSLSPASADKEREE